MTDEIKAIATLRADYKLFASKVLQISTKNAGLQPFSLNKAQRTFTDVLEEQKQRTGKVRMLVIKGRQMGISTCITSRHYHQCIFNKGIQALALAHKQDAAKGLMRMVKTYHYKQQLPLPLPPVSTDNESELLFEGKDNIDSGYSVATAGGQEVGRSRTFQRIHWSEVAFTENAYDHAAGLLQTVPDADDTEIIMESTANGTGNYFYEMVMQALHGESDYEVCFLPFYWDDGYKRTLDESFVVSTDRPSEDIPSEQEYLDEYGADGLTPEHLYWRRRKVATDFRGDWEKFRQEYPMSITEAFETSATEALIKPAMIRQAYATEAIPGSNAPIVVGVDPAGEGKDRFAYSARQGRNLLFIKTLPKSNLVQSSTTLFKELEKLKPAIVNVDVGGLGIGVYDNLVSMGLGKICKKVNFGGKPIDENDYDLKQSEMFGALLEWLEDVPVSLACLDSETLERVIAQASSRKHKWKHGNCLSIESKVDFKKRLKYSPDEVDAIMLTFATPITKGAYSGASKASIGVAQTGFNVFGGRKNKKRY